MPDSLVQALLAHLEGVFAGPNGDYPAVLEALAGITAIQAAFKPAQACNSIWQIVDHLAASKIWQIDMLEKGQAAPPAWTHLGSCRMQICSPYWCPSGTRHGWNSCFPRQPTKRITAARSTI